MTILVLLPWGLQQGAGLVGAGTKLLTNERSASTEVFKNNITDLYTVDKMNGNQQIHKMILIKSGY